MSDLELLTIQFKKKDEKAFEQLYDMYTKSIHGFICNMVKDTDIADDLTQEVFIKAWNNAESYAPEKGRFFTWVLNIARNTAIDKLRSKAYKQSKHNLNTRFLENTITNTVNFNSKSDAIGLKSVIKSLAPKRLKIIELLYFKGFTQKEASEHLDIPLGTVKTRSRDSIKKLKSLVV